MNFQEFYIGNKKIGTQEPTFVIAEIGLAHDGSLGAAHSFIDAIADSGADAIKFQTHIASQESTPNEPFRVNIFPQDKSRYEYWERTSFNEEQWINLKKHAEEKKLIFLSTPFSIEAARLLKRIGIKAWKVGSGEINNFLLLEELSTYKLPILLSSGMSYVEELDKSINFLKSKKIPSLLMQCTSKYPSDPEEYGLNLINYFKSRYKIPIGFSDHSGEIATAHAAVALGADAVELHLTWSKECFGPDSNSSLTLPEFRDCINGLRNIERGLKNPVDKNKMADSLKEMRYLFNKGLIVNKNIKKGTLITKDILDARKPCEGIQVNNYKDVIGKIITKDLIKGSPLKFEFLIDN